MTILSDDWSIGDHGFWQSMTDQEIENWSFSNMEQADIVQK